MQFSVNAPALPSIPQLLSRASSDIIGKQAGRIVLGLGLDEMKREAGNAEKVAANYAALVDEILKKTQSYLDFVTVPKDLLPEIDGQVCALNESIRSCVSKAPDRVRILDFE